MNRDRLFKSNDRNLKYLKQHYEDISVYDEDLIYMIGVLDKEVLDTQKYLQKNQRYTFFKVLKIEDVNSLRKSLFLDRSGDEICEEKILRFFEIHLRKLHSKLKINYSNIYKKLYFKQLVVSYFLELYYYKKDFRFLNIAIKTLRLDKVYQYHGLAKIQRKYNLLLTEELLNSLSS